MYTFDDWITAVFTNAARGSKFWERIEDTDLTAPVIVEFMTRLFEDSDDLLRQFNNLEVDEGLGYVVRAGTSDYMFALLDQEVPWTARQQCIRSMKRLYTDCFARTCDPNHLSHPNSAESIPLNGVCYMWWDILPIYGCPNDPSRFDLDFEMINVMSFALSIDSDACRESVLHGLGHWHLDYPSQVEAIIDEFLKQNPMLRSDLVDYALNARLGYVL